MRKRPSSPSTTRHREARKRRCQRGLPWTLVLNLLALLSQYPSPLAVVIPLPLHPPLMLMPNPTFPEARLAKRRRPRPG